MDERKEKSKKSIKGALISIMENSQFKDIKVSDIILNANVTRGTFYNHYDSKVKFESPMKKQEIYNLKIFLNKIFHCFIT